MTPQPSAFVVAVVHDDEDVVRLLKGLLESKNHTVRIFTSAAALVESGCLPQLNCVVLDIVVPGMDGAIKQIHVARPGLATILITDHPDRVKRLPRLAGIYPGLFMKPCKAEELFAAVRAVFRAQA